MEDHMTSSDVTGTGNSHVTMVTDSMGPDTSAGLSCQSDSYMRNRIRELERSERSLLMQLCQLASVSHLPSMQHSQRLDQRLHMLREEVRTMTQEKEHGERVWRDRLQRCQRQLKAKEDEMSRQSQYFENFKTQLQHKLSLARDREQSLQSRIYTLEKQLLDMTVSAATGMAATSAVRITAGTATHWGEQERLPPMRGEGEGEEERKEEQRRQWQPSVGKDKKCEEGGGVQDTKQTPNEAKLQGFILSLQEDLRVLLVREEGGVTERRGLMEQLQEAQENNHFLGCKVEGMKAEVQQLTLSERSLMEEMEELREENHRLLQILQDPANRTTGQTSMVPESTCQSPGSSNLTYTTAMGQSSAGSLGEVCLMSDEGRGQLHPSAVSPVHHQAAGETMQDSEYSSAKSETPIKIQSLSLTTETLDEFKLGTWCSGGILNLEESPSEESNALQEAYRSLGLGQDLEGLQEQQNHLEAALERTQEQLQVMTQDNIQLKLQLRKELQEAEVEQRHSREEDDLIQALNQENRALADRIQQLLAHIELREEEVKREQTQMKEHISKLEADRVGLEQEHQEQECLITELTRKTEDDLNTIMELQQRLSESERKEMQSKCTAAISEHFRQNNLEEDADSLVESVLKGEEPLLMSHKQPDDLSAASALCSQHNSDYDVLQNSSESSQDVSSLANQVGQLMRSVQSLKTEEEELTDCIKSLREQQKEVTLSVHTQTEVKQQLTRTVWALKEEKDNISQTLVGLKQEREQLTRRVCGLKDERDQIIRSMSGLKEEKESLSGLQKEKEKLLESLSSGKEEQDQILELLQSLKTEREQLSQAVHCLKQERDELTESLKCLNEQMDKDQSLQEEWDKLVKTVSSLREDKERIEHSITCLVQEEKQINVLLQGQKERNILQAALTSQIQTEGKNQKQLNPNSIITARNTETLTGTEDTQRSLSRDHKEQSDPMRDIEAELKRSRDELDRTHADTMRLQSELCQSEVKREEAEKKVVRLTEVANQIEETTKENDSLISQVKQMQSKLTVLMREKTDALSLKAQTEEQYNVLTAQLKAKTVALEELNSEYIALKRGQGNKEDQRAVLISLRTRYNEIRAKYDELLKKRSQNDLEITPLKAKLSCLVAKCQERNSLLVQMMKAMHGRGCVDSSLTQQVEQLLSDAALQDYTAAFTPGSFGKTRDYSSGFTPGFISKVQEYTSAFTPDQTCSVILPPNHHLQNALPSESGKKCTELKSEKKTFLLSTESKTNPKDCSDQDKPAPETLKTNANSTVPTSPVQEHARVQTTPSPVPPLKESVQTNTAQLSPSASGPENFGFHQSDKKGNPSPDLTGLTGSSLTPTPSSSSTRVSLSRRLSSPEKIINLHEQLQKTLMSSYQAPVGRGRGQQPRSCFSFSAPADLRPASQTKQQSFSSNILQTNLLPVSAATIQAQHTPATTNKSATLFTAVASRSAHVTFSPNISTNQHLKVDTLKTTASALSSSSNSSFSATAPCRAKSPSSSVSNMTTSPKLTQKIAEKSDAKLRASSPLTPRTTTVSSHVLRRSDTNLNSTASDITALSITTAPEAHHLHMPSETDGAAPSHHRLAFAASCTRPDDCSPERSNKSAGKSSSLLENTKTARSKPGAPAEVRSVEVIRTVGQSSLLIGWERPPLDELGCSNGTFVYGYRVFVDGDFHKSVMSSACTKCILENVDLTVPLHISVQTLGSNGLSSDFVHNTYRVGVLKLRSRNLHCQWPKFRSAQPSIAAALCGAVLTSTSADSEGDAVTLQGYHQAQVNQSEQSHVVSLYQPMNMQ